MTFLLFLPIILSSVVLAAHFLREGRIFLTLVCLAIPFFLLKRERWVVFLLQGFLLMGASVWIYTLVKIAQVRMVTGEDWKRMAFILGGVALVTAGSALLLRTQRAQAYFNFS
ncbi:MAG: hypothetical protein Q7S00_00575 [bacterium]|nr:hypothetical protein [bacterium]